MSAFFGYQAQLLGRAILGYREPHQLAWALALGVLLGCVLQGNLVAIAVLLFILSVRVNHAVVAVAAAGMMLVIGKLDAQTHLVGKYVLTHPDLSYHLAAAWQWPIVPWTDLNNTVVMGSLILGLVALPPVFLFSYPIFHALVPPCCDLSAPQSPSAPSGPAATQPAAAADAAGRETTRMKTQPQRAPAPLNAGAAAQGHGPASVPGTDPEAIDAAFGDVAAAEQAARQVTVDTRIEVVRMAPAASTHKRNVPGVEEVRSATELQSAASEISRPDPPMSEALNYLLRQLRDSRQRRAA